jgi:hypothetical protein
MWHCEFPDLRLQGKISMMATVVESITQTFHAECIGRIEVIGGSPATSARLPAQRQTGRPFKTPMA